LGSFIEDAFQLVQELEGQPPDGNIEVHEEVAYEHLDRTF
jgi:hypothetical protein